MMAIVHLLMWVAPWELAHYWLDGLGEAGGIHGILASIDQSRCVCGYGAFCPCDSWLCDAPVSVTISRPTFSLGLCQSHEHPTHDRILNQFQFGHVTLNDGRSD